MPIPYKIITAVLALTGCVSLVITGEMNPLMSVSGIALIPGYYRFLKGARHAPGWTVGMLSALTLVVFLFDAAVISTDVFLAVAHLTIAFQAIKGFDLKEPWDHLQVYFMSLLQLIIASELTHSLAFGVVFILFMIMLVTAMILSHFLKEGALGRIDVKKPVFFISALTLLTTIIFFTAFPRTSYKFIGKGHFKGIKTTGFTEKVDFGSFGDVKLDPTVIMRIEMDRDMGADLPYYWRGMSLDYFDGSSWRQSVSAKYRLTKAEDEYVVSLYDKRSAVEQRIYLEPIDSDIIFGLAEIKGVRTESFPLLTDTARGIYLPRKASGGIKYTVYSVIGAHFQGIKDRMTRYLQLPEGAGRIIDLAGKITAGAKTDDRMAFQIEQYLKKNYTYSLSVSMPPKGVSPLEDFLFNSKKGFCEHYATSMVVMLRGLGIPSRIVNGFYGGERNKYGGYLIVRQSDAHSWVEAFIDGMWRRFDPTPSVKIPHPSAFALFLDSVSMNWSRYVVGFSASDQKRIVRTLSVPFTLPSGYALKFRDVKPLLFVVGIIIACSCLIYFFKSLRLKKHGYVTGQYLALQRLMKNKGLRVSPSITAGDIRKEAFGFKTGGKIAEFIMMYEEYRFGQKTMDAENKKRYALLLKEIRKG